MDAHNCYPYWEWWYDRIDRALSAGTPLAIEQDLYWYTDAKTGRSWSVVAHGAPVSGHEPTMEHYFFDRVRPVVERALKESNHGDWPLITLNLDLKTEEPEHLRAILALGKIAHDSVCDTLGAKKSAHPFKHGASYEIGKLTLISSYHCSRYNTNTRVLTPEMFDAVVKRAKMLAMPQL